MVKIDKRTKRNTHPGWAIQFEDGTWLGGAHGWFRSKDAFYADIFGSSKKAEEMFQFAKQGEEVHWNLSYKVVPAWEPLCEKLRLEVQTLSKIAKIDWGDMWDICLEIRSAVNRLEEAYNGDDEEDLVEEDDDND